MMSAKTWGCCLAAAMIALAVFGCRKKETAPVQGPQAAGPGAAEIAAVRDALTRGMQPISLNRLDKTHIGKRCVVAARSGPIPPPPPPLGMVRIMGSTTLYMGELNDVSPDAIKIRAPYPSSGNFKSVEIPRADVESIHVGD
jgi:hypothetical protein